MRPFVLACGASLALLVANHPTTAASETPKLAQLAQDKAPAGSDMSDKNGKQEPSAKANPSGSDDPVFLNGALNVPGAPKDSQTVPAKFSSRNDAIDKLPIMAITLQLTNEQRKRIATALQGTPPTKTNFSGKASQEVPFPIELSELPAGVTAEMPDLKSLKYLRLPDRILLVEPTNRIVLGAVESDMRR